MKKIFMLLLIFLFFSCSSDKINMEGKFIKVLSKNKEYNVYTFDFNDTFEISNNGDNYLVSDKNGNKTVATMENGILNFNNCKILLDKKENVLVKTCTQGNKSYSNDYWPKVKVDKYLANIKEIKFDEYLNRYLMIYDDEGGFAIRVAKINALNDIDKKLIEERKKEYEALNNNPYFPFMAFGDFNNDNKYPDIAAITKLDFDYVSIYNYDEAYTSLTFLFAGSEKLKDYKFKEFYPLIENSGDIQNSNSVLIVNLKDRSGWSIWWERRRAHKEYVNLH